MNKVNLIIPGTSKAGTTSLFYYLKQHSDIYLPSIKETHFFDNDSKFDRGCSWYYENYFNAANNEKIIGEITPGYLRKSDIVINRIKKCCSPNLKLVFILRDPVQRAFSHYQHMVRNGKENLPFHEALMKEPDRKNAGWYTYYQEGLYGSHLKSWYENFNQEKILIIDHKDLLKNPKQTICNIFDFLEIENQDINTDKKFNVQSKVRFKTLNKVINSPPEIIKKIYKSTFGLIITKNIKEKIRSKLKHLNLQAKKKRIIIDPIIEKDLRLKYQTDIENLESLTGLNFTHWKL